MLINCAKGCGIPIEISMEQIEEAQRINTPLNVSHSICPGADGVLNRVYTVTVRVTRKDDGDEEGRTLVLLSEVGGSAGAPTFAEAFDRLTETLSKRWEEVQKWAPIADVDDTTLPLNNEGDTGNAEGPQ